MVLLSMAGRTLPLVLFRPVETGRLASFATMMGHRYRHSRLDGGA